MWNDSITAINRYRAMPYHNSGFILPLLSRQISIDGVMLSFHMRGNPDRQREIAHFSRYS